MKLLLILLFSLDVAFGDDTTGRTLSLVQIVFRHGDRAPTELYPNDPNTEASWPEGLGKLTLLGKQQLYSLGKYLRFLYGGFITSNPNEVNVNSTGLDRCLRSAECFLASFTAPTTPWQFEKGVDWQPIPVFYLPEDEDMYLSQSCDCPQADAQENKTSQDDVQILDMHRDLINDLEQYTGSQINNLGDYHKIFDTIYIEKRHNLSTPYWANNRWQEMTDLFNEYYTRHYSTEIFKKLRAGPLIHLLKENMYNKVNGQYPSVKFQVYSTRRGVITTVLKALNAFNDRAPPYGATILFELYQESVGNSLRILYLNSSTPESVFQTPNVLQLSGCSEYCPLQYFSDSVKGLFSLDFSEECELPEDSM